MLLIALKQIPGTVQISPGQSFYEQNDDQRAQWLLNGFARPAEMQAVEPVAAKGPAMRGPVPDWTGATVVIVASGPSLTVEQCDHVMMWQMTPAPELRRVIAINTSYQRAPFADMLYACDGAWWRAKVADRPYVEAARATMPHAMFYTQDEKAAKDFGLHYVRSQKGAGLSRKVGLIHQGMSSTYQAMGIAYHAGARRIVLLGVDCRGGHWHGNHPAPLPNSLPHKQWIDHFVGIARDLKAEGIEVVNCSPGTAVTAFPSGAIEDALPL